MGQLIIGTALDAGLTRRWMRALGEVIESQCDYLTRLDAAIGDADHGINMRRGFRAVRALDLPGDRPGRIFQEVGRQLVITVGGAAGPLYGTAFRSLGAALGDSELVDPIGLVDGLAAALWGVQELGAAVEGDKTMVDAFSPAVRGIRAVLEESRPLAAALAAGADRAEAGMTATIPLRALKGRASYLGERSVGHQDPGATSTAYLFRTLAEVVGS